MESDQSLLDEFPDASRVSEYAVEAMGWGVLTRLISGVGTPTGPQLQPQGNATRAQIARIIMNFYIMNANLRWNEA